MGQRRYRIPSTSALVAFESVARLGGIGRAADELNTSQSAVSRHIKHIEDEFGTRLTEKSGRGIVITRAGEAYLRVVTTALESLNAAGSALRAADEDVTIACTHEVSHLLLMPHFARLRESLGRGARIRILTCEYETVPLMVNAGADLTFEYVEDVPETGCIEILPEEIVPVASPSFLAMHAGILAQQPGAWRGVPRLALTKANLGWATWEDWFAAIGTDAPATEVETHDNYVYLLEAAAAGAGLALGWRGFVDRYLQSEALVAVSGRWITRPPKLVARLTRRGERNRNAVRFLPLLSRLLSNRRT
ncbi:LysR family transcriptional regulator [Defluviimonas sp. WL0024]|uniref:LysR family transcriptional regulator n=2 Tax=Albidovulum TaxID=205889 RepID=A0ABT3J7P5_9RHOB|nr:MULTISPECIES: LysR family transcriptional regulator [Defluviimonas]MCU9850122.1 LysR family transcriptional regulator [Defluviimonas sp. WL0024]MCW3783712.1 LysR family transcriptional regulator [Defluviimonas salinarum]